MNIFQPAVLIRYHESMDSVLIVTYDIDGKQHYGKPREMKHENLPLLLFQLVDRGYHIIPNTDKIHPLQNWKECHAFSPEFERHVRAEADKKLKAIP